MYDELGEYVQTTCQQSDVDKVKMPTLSFMDRIDKLSGDYDIQQEYALSNLKESIFQIQHGTDQV